MKVAVIDLGTNTAHILIAESAEKKLKVLEKVRHYTFLAENGIASISKDAIDRLFHALKDFKLKTEAHQVHKVIITGTEAFRKAKNGEEITKRILAEYSWQVEIISGDEEANYIFHGVRQAVDIRQGHFLIMDIGGGSVEFILSQNGKNNWQKSFPIGIAKIHNSSIMKDSLSDADILEIKRFITSHLSPLESAIQHLDDITLVGAAGSFEILTKDLSKKDNLIYSEIKRRDFEKLMNEVIYLPPVERAKVAWIPKERVKYVTAAILLIEVALEISKSEDVIISPYALKEGIAAEALALNQDDR